MKQNKYFSLNRFFLLLRNDWLIHQKTYLFTLAGMSIAIYSIAFISMQNAVNYNINNYKPLLVFFLIGVGAFIGSAFPVLKDSIKTTNYLLTPGSTLEKVMVQFLIRMVIFIPLALLIFWIAMHLAKASLFSNPERSFFPMENIPDFHFSYLFINNKKFMDQFTLILSIFSGATILFAGSAYFKKFAVVKTLIVSLVMVGVVALSFVFFSHILFPAETHGFHINLPGYEITGELYNYQLAAYILGGLSWLFFLPLAYFKLKEKEV